MPSLKETKTHIGSVKSTLKITSAMKLVAAAKLHRAQLAVENIRPYAGLLSRILADLRSDIPILYTHAREDIRRVAMVAFASNSSLCGGFNANALRLVLETIDAYHAQGIEDITVYAVGRKLADALKKVAGITVLTDAPSIPLSPLSDHPAYSTASALADALAAAYADGTYDRIDLVYNHFHSTASQKPVREAFLPLAIPSEAKESISDFLIEPSPSAACATLLPQVVRLALYTTLLDSAAAEHAARTIAMQTATDNAEDLLDTLTLEYNKARQQKITAEILDIVGGSMAQ